MSKVSIAMTTYNGEKFLEQQLLSIFNQTRQPDEVIICDDGSSDRTVMIVQQFITKYNLQDSWKIIKNKYNKGLTKNFLECASMTTGDIVFFSDQDDVWMANKIFKMATLFEHNDKIKAMSCNFTCIDKESNRSEFILNMLLKGKVNMQQVPFSMQVRDGRSGGLTLAVRRELLDYVKPIIFQYNLPYDLPMGLLASAFGGHYLLRESLVYRRVHPQNFSTPKYTLKSRIQNVGYHISSCSFRLKLMKACAKILDDKLSKNERENLRRAIKLLEKSLVNLQTRKIIPLFLDIFSINPMINRVISVDNFLCAFFGDYTQVKTDVEE